MEKLLENWLALLLIAIALGIFSFAVRLRQVTLIEDGKTITPKWYSTLRYLVMLAAIALFCVNFGGFSAFFVYSFVGILGGSDRILSIVIVAIVVYLLWFVGKHFGQAVRNRIIWKDVVDFFEKDDIAQKMLQDMERGAKEIRIYSMRVEGLRSFHFDVDGLNRSAYSADGCIQMGRYLMAFASSGTKYEMDICYEDDGIQSASSGSAMQSGNQKFRFSHVSLQASNQ